MPRRTLRAAVVAAIGLGSAIVPVVTAQPAAAASTLTCHSAALVIGVSASGSSSQLWHHPHNEPETGANSWGARAGNVGLGWHIGRALPGPNGVMYLLVNDTTGDLRRYRWTGTQWETYNGAWWRGVGTGWSRYNQIEHRNKVTVDEKGRLYELAADGTLKVRIWQGDDANGNWTPDTKDGKVIATGWGDYNLIAAAGDGVIFARKANGDLHRYRWNADARRFMPQGLPGQPAEIGPKVGAGWQDYDRIFSPGGDILYATWPGNDGRMMWYRWLEDDFRWASNLGTVAGSGGFNNHLDVGANANSCWLTGFPVPQRPSVPRKENAPSTVVQGADGKLSFFYVNSVGGLTVAKQINAGQFDPLEYQTFPEYHSFTGQPGVAKLADGKLDVLANSYADGDYRGKTQQVANGVWGNDNLFSQGGWMASDPVVMQTTAGPVTFAVDAAGAMWHRTASSATWSKFAEGPFTTDFSVAGNIIVARRTDNTGYALTYAPPPGRGIAFPLGPDFVGKPSAVKHPNGELQVFVRRADGKIYTRRGSASLLFPGPWQPVGDFVTAGDPVAQLLDDTLVQVAVRGPDNLVHVASQVAPAAGFGPWTVPRLYETVTDPAGTVTADKKPVFTWRTPEGLVAAIQVGPSGQVVTSAVGRSAN